MLNPSIFPDDILRVLAKHMKNPKASTAADPKLVKVLAQYDSNTTLLPTLESVIIGEEFYLRKRKFRKLEVKRTRALCLDLTNNRRYLISQIAEISPIHKEDAPKAEKVVLVKKLGKANSTPNNQITVHIKNLHFISYKVSEVDAANPTFFYIIKPFLVIAVIRPMKIEYVFSY